MFIWIPKNPLTKSILLKILDISYNPLLNFKTTKKFSKEHFFNIIESIYGDSETKLKVTNSSGFKNIHDCECEGVVCGYRVEVPVNNKKIKKNFSWGSAREEEPSGPSE